MICRLTSESNTHKQGGRGACRRTGMERIITHFSSQYWWGSGCQKWSSAPNLVCFVDGRRALNQLLLFDATIPPALSLLIRVLWLRVASYRSNSREGRVFFQINAKLRRNKLYEPANTIHRTTKWMKQVVSSKPWVSILPALPAGEVENRNGNPSSIPLAVTCCGN